MDHARAPPFSDGRNVIPEGAFLPPVMPSTADVSLYLPDHPHFSDRHGELFLYREKLPPVKLRIESGVGGWLAGLWNAVNSVVDVVGAEHVMLLVRWIMPYDSLV